MAWRRQPRSLVRSLLEFAGFLVVLSATLILLQRLDMIDLGSGNATVVDGDSLRLSGADVRLAGIDAPEYRQQCRDERQQSYACGKQARTALVSMINGREVHCISVETDRYGRAISDCKAGEINLAREMVRQGWAIAYRDFRYSGVEVEARRAKRGIWAGEFERPADYRARERLDRADAASIASDSSDALEMP